MSPRCPAWLTVDFDGIGCTNDEGHTGPHRDHGEDGEFVWMTAETYDAADAISEADAVRQWGADA